jgi:hypothetical protein
LLGINHEPTCRGIALKAQSQSSSDPRVLKDAVERAVDRLCGPAQAEHADAIRRELETVRRELANLAAAIGSDSRDVPTLMTAIHAREARQRELLDDLNRRPNDAELDPRTVLAELQERLNDWRELLRDHTPQARGLLKQLIVGRLDMEPDEAGFYRFTGTGTLSALLSGIIPQQLVPQSGVPNATRGSVSGGATRSLR